ncbi:class I SAM-dependent methyltransferase [Vibrio sp. S9_S30]|uniref:O-methyltransferase n=1 Tax=Vibrio sp. S9_S30 TaxID=2720226 RepID=UPI001681B537|nr:class I SAM-dependent methyltransferase [Vibrio sp. S9_S30]MBD1555686.1 class I SAM-dependent methyltransferase [Vibrio sp. S9_S30]
MPNVVARAVKSWLKTSVHKVNGFRARLELESLMEHESPEVQAVGAALYDALNNTYSPDEKVAFEKIEQRRATLLGSNAEISVLDYGAGHPNIVRTQEEMALGIEFHSTIGAVCCSSKPAFWGVFLFKLIRYLKPDTCLELGSCVGISACYQAAALKMNQKGKILTLEGSPEVAKIAQESLDFMELKNASVVTGPFHSTFQNTLEAHQTIDYLFNDGHHDHDAVLNYFNTALPYLAKTTVMIIDDINWSEGMQNAWKKIEEDERVALSIDLNEIGIALITDTLLTKEVIKIPL